jgi:transcriptional regulator with XRE-family HTH domain
VIDRQEASAEYICKLLAQSPMPRNQVAALSGLTNTYIRDLERGIIANVGRDKLISLSVALNLDLIETDQMLKIFDRSPLSLDDIGIFLQTAER